MRARKRRDPALTVYTDLIQGTEEWKAARCGLLTASVVGKLITPTLRVADNDISRSVTLSLAAERITGHVDDMPISASMWRGKIEEPLAREKYAEVHAPVVEVGLMVRNFGGVRLGFSPDGLVGDDGAIEIKSRSQKVQVKHVLDGDIPAENMAQLQAGLLVSGRKWIDYISYSGGMALWRKRVTPDSKWFEVIVAAAQQFETNAADIVARYQAATDGLPMTERTPDPFLEPVIA